MTRDRNGDDLDRQGRPGRPEPNTAHECRLSQLTRARCIGSVPFGDSLCCALGAPASRFGHGRPGTAETYGRASYTRLNGVSAARRKRVKPPVWTTSRIRASPACAPSASPTSWDNDAGVHSRVENP